MSHALPPDRTAGTAAQVGSAVAAAFARRGSARPAAPAAPAPAPVREADEEGGWDPAEVLARPGSTRAATRAPRPLTLDEVWAAQAVEEGAADWTPQAPPKDAPSLSGAALAAHALSRLSRRS